MERVPRTALDRTLTMFRLTARYSCRNSECGWQGLVFGAPNPTALRLGILLVVLFVSWSIPTCVVPIVELMMQRPPDTETVPDTAQ